MLPDDVRARSGAAGPAVPEVLDDLHTALERLWDSAPDIPRGDRIRFETAVVEVATNVVGHALPVRSVVQLRAEFQVTATTLEGTLTDDGADVDIDLTGSTPADTAESGRGLLLIQRTVDTFSFRREDGLNVWRLARRYTTGAENAAPAR